ncbi:UNKNOWN [Stylonychia lemnae]|uniref:Uncharacterized protein n=1 Tax=Stylonychia lemnae TaxID=5949 RepID=A0A078B8W5_STYLE|nr:UNKNOWN [Stylonychia lemnae]|eukprot:CDW89988.1 UNKNOWN [Stylonychia lemnae]
MVVNRQQLIKPVLSKKNNTHYDNLQDLLPKTPSGAFDRELIKTHRVFDNNSIIEQSEIKKLDYRFLQAGLSDKKSKNSINDKEVELLVLLSKLKQLKRDPFMCQNKTQFLINLQDQALKAFDIILDFEDLQFKEHLRIIRGIISMLVFEDKLKLPNFLKDEIFESDLNLESSPQVCYFELYEKSMRAYKKSIKECKKLQIREEFKVSQLEAKMEINDKSYKKLLDDFNRLSSGPNKVIDDGLTEIIDQEDDFRKMETKFYKKKIALRECKAEFIKLIIDHKALKEKFEKLEKEYTEKENVYAQGFQNYNNALFLLKQSQEKIAQLTQYSNNLEDENSKLLIRGSISFSELTPRFSKMKELFKEHKIKEPTAKMCRDGSKHPRHVSSAQYVECLFQELDEKRAKVRELKKQVNDQKIAHEREKASLSSAYLNGGSTNFQTPGNQGGHRQSVILKRQIRPLKSLATNLVNNTDNSSQEEAASNGAPASPKRSQKKSQVQNTLSSPNIILDDQSKRVLFSDALHDTQIKDNDSVMLEIISEK